MKKHKLHYSEDLVDLIGLAVSKELELAYTKLKCPKCTKPLLELCYVRNVENHKSVITGPFRGFIQGYLYRRDSCSE